MERESALPRVLTNIIEGKIELKYRVSWSCTETDVSGHGEWMSYKFEPADQEYVDLQREDRSHSTFYRIEHDSEPWPHEVS